MIYLTKDKVEPLTGIGKIGIGTAWKASGGGKKGFMGLGGKLKKMQGADLDACAVALSDGAPKRMAWFDNLDAFDDGTLVHFGDDKRGRAAGDNEFIKADLARMPGSIDEVVFMVSAFKQGVSFADVEGVTFNVYNLGLSNEQPIKVAEFMPDLDARQNCCVVAKVKRSEADPSLWQLTVVNALDRGADRQGLLDLARRYA